MANNRADHYRDAADLVGTFMSEDTDDVWASSDGQNAGDAIREELYRVADMMEADPNLYFLLTDSYCDTEDMSWLLVRAASENDARAVGVESSKLGHAYEGFSDADDMWVTLVTDKGRGLVSYG